MLRDLREREGKRGKGKGREGKGGREGKTAYLHIDKGSPLITRKTF